jgi:hypothetical protein
MQWLKALCLVVVSSFAGTVSAASISKCVDAAGKVTFTQNQNCPRSHTLADVSSYRNAPPSGSGPAVEMADTTPRPATPKRDGQSFTVVGAPPPVQPVAEPAPDKQVVVRQAPNNQPCVKTVDRLVSGSRKNADGTTTGRAQMIKVVVPC